LTIYFKIFNLLNFFFWPSSSSYGKIVLCRSEQKKIGMRKLGREGSKRGKEVEHKGHPRGKERRRGRGGE
jgi:hypothetical protein